MNRYSGTSLIELVVFIVVIGIIATGSFVALNTVLTHNNHPAQNLQAATLADATMNTIILYRLVNGFGSIADPCLLTVSPACVAGPDACQDLCAYAASVGLSVTTPIPFVSGTIGVGDDPGVTTSDTSTATVAVTGIGQASNVVEFIE